MILENKNFTACLYDKKNCLGTMGHKAKDIESALWGVALPIIRYGATVGSSRQNNCQEEPVSITKSTALINNKVM